MYYSIEWSDSYVIGYSDVVSAELLALEIDRLFNQRGATSIKITKEN